MKRFFALLIALLMIFCVAACDEKGNNGDGTKDNGSTKPKAAVSFYVNYNSTKIELGGDAKAVITALGTPKSTSPMGNCGGQGTLTKYTYASIEIYVLTSGDTSLAVDTFVVIANNVGCGVVNGNKLLLYCESILVQAVISSELLKLTLAASLTGEALSVMCGKDKLKSCLSGSANCRCVCKHLHTLFYGVCTGSCKSASAYDLNYAYTASADAVDILQITEGGDIYAYFLSSLQDSCSFGNAYRNIVNC